MIFALIWTKIIEILVVFETAVTMLWDFCSVTAPGLTHTRREINLKSASSTLVQHSLTPDSPNLTGIDISSCEIDQSLSNNDQTKCIVYNYLGKNPASSSSIDHTTARLVICYFKITPHLLFYSILKCVFFGQEMADLVDLWSQPKLHRWNPKLTSP